MIEILPTDNDDSNFTVIVGKILNSFIQNSEPEEIYIFKIDHWFDFKWRAFSGKMLGAVGFWNDKELRIPPFIPDRVEEQSYFQRENKGYIKQEAYNLHIYQTSSNNITGKRKLVTSSEPRFFLWFSGDTKNTLRGSLMIYQIKKEDSSTLYVSFLKKEDWQIYKTDGISRQEISSLL